LVLAARGGVHQRAMIVDEQRARCCGPCGSARAARQQRCSRYRQRGSTRGRQRTHTAARQRTLARWRGGACGTSWQRRGGARQRGILLWHARQRARARRRSVHRVAAAARRRRIGAARHHGEGRGGVYLPWVRWA